MARKASVQGRISDINDNEKSYNTKWSWTAGDGGPCITVSSATQPKWSGAQRFYMATRWILTQDGVHTVLFPGPFPEDYLQLHRGDYRFGIPKVIVYGQPGAGGGDVGVGVEGQ